MNDASSTTRTLDAPLLSLSFDLVGSICHLVNGYDVAALYLTGNRRLRHMLQHGGAKKMQIRSWYRTPLVWPRMVEELDQLEELVLTATYERFSEHLTTPPHITGVPSLKRLTFEVVADHSGLLTPKNVGTPDYGSLFPRLEHLQISGLVTSDFFALLPSTLTSLALPSSLVPLDVLKLLPSTLISLDIVFSREPASVKDGEQFSFPLLLEHLKVLDLPSQALLLGLPKNLLTLELRHSVPFTDHTVSILDWLAVLPSGLKSLQFLVREWPSLRPPCLNVEIALALPRQLEVLVISREADSFRYSLEVDVNALDTIFRSLPSTLKRCPITTDPIVVESMRIESRTMIKSAMEGWESIDSLFADRFCVFNKWLPPNVKEMTTECAATSLEDTELPSSMTSLTFKNGNGCPPNRLPPHLKRLVVYNLPQVGLPYWPETLQLPRIEVLVCSHFPLSGLRLLPPSVTDMTLAFSGPYPPRSFQAEDIESDLGLLVIDFSRFPLLNRFCGVFEHYDQLELTQPFNRCLLEFNLPGSIRTFEWRMLHPGTKSGSTGGWLNLHSIQLLYTGHRHHNHRRDVERIPSYHVRMTWKISIHISRQFLAYHPAIDESTTVAAPPSPSHIDRSFRVPFYALDTHQTPARQRAGSISESLLYRLEDMKTVFIS